MPYTLRESPEFTAEVTQWEDLPFLDEALEILLWTIAKAPEVFPIIPGYTQLRLARRARHERRDGIIPEIVIWYRIASPTIIDLLELQIRFED